MNTLKLLTLLLLSWIAPAQAVEQPTYTLLRTHEFFEVRNYEPFVVAEVVVPGPANEAVDQAFPLLAGFVFGQNRSERKWEMTAPLMQTALRFVPPAPATADPIEMVETVLVQLMLPRESSPAGLPEPLDPRVRFREVPRQRLAVIQYSGSWSQANYEEHLELLRQALSQAGIMVLGDPVFSSYDAPLTPWFWRTNEIWLRVQ